MPDLFIEQALEQRDKVRPLADRLRPTTLSDFIGQTHMLGDESLLRRMIMGDTLTSVIFWGAPGIGKTTLAYVIANETKGHVESFNAAMIGVSDIRRIIDEAKKRIDLGNGRTFLLLDEIHRFNRNQQDVLLEAVEQGIIILIGATTENPAYTVNNSLISRSNLFQLEPLTNQDIESILRRALTDQKNALEIAVQSTNEVIDLEVAQQSMQRKAVRYDKHGDNHYDHASALIKSVRNGDTNASLYWLASMLEAGEDPRFIARRMSIFASEDIGLADARALEQAAAVWSIVEKVGMPECQFALSQLVVYLSKAEKSRAVCDAITQARDDVSNQRAVIAPSDHDPNALPTINATYFQ